MINETEGEKLHVREINCLNPKSLHVYDSPVSYVPPETCLACVDKIYITVKPVLN